jgi:hypothetical protein
MSIHRLAHILAFDEPIKVLMSDDKMRIVINCNKERMDDITALSLYLIFSLCFLNSAKFQWSTQIF